MRKNIAIFFMILLMLLLSSCKINESSSKDSLISPNNNTPPIEGKWVLKEYFDTLGGEALDGDQIELGLEGLFHKNAIIIGKDYATNPSFKIKTVKAADYLVYKYKLTPEELNIDSEKIQVITILNDNQYFNEFIKYNDRNIIVNIDNGFYRMEKVTEEVSLDETLRYIEIEKAMVRDFETTESEKKETGILLGFKIPTYDRINELLKWDYRTIWIRSKDKNIMDSYEMDDLLLPHRSGFSLINQKINSLKIDQSPLNIQNILFVGNNHISIENIDTNNDRRSLGIYSIDNIKNGKPMKISDIIGDEGKEIFLEGAQNVFSLDESIVVNESNISLVRKNAHWIFNGRINYKQNDKELYKDFNIRSIPPKEMVSYDEHIIPWEAVKRRVPEAIDMYSSPNEEFIVVVTNYNLQIFNIENKEEISQHPSKKINLPTDASVIMSEWASGRYVDLWEREVIRQNGVKIEE